MPYDLQLIQINTNLGGLGRSNTNWGFPANTPFHTLLMSYWMCGPWSSGPGLAGSPGIWPAFTSASFFGFGPGVNSVFTGNPFIAMGTTPTPYTPFFSGNIPTPQPTTPVGCLLHFMMSVDTRAQIVQVYVNDVPQTVTGAWVSGGPWDFTVADSINIWNWDVSAVIATGIHPAMGDAWISNTPTFVDLSIAANRRKFIDAAMRPVDLGNAGTIPFGYQPAMYMSVRPGGVPADILLNRGINGGSWGYAQDPPSFQTDGTCVAIPPPPGPTTLTDAELYFTPGTGFVDLADINARRKFVSAAGCAQWLGAEGELPFGQPSVYLSAEPGDAAAFADNRGAAEDFAINGSIDLAGSAPCCTSYVTTEAADHNANPEWRLTVSDDGGRTWSLLVKPRAIGKTGEYLTRLRWMKLGHSRERMIRLESSDAVRRNIVGFYFDITQGMG